MSKAEAGFIATASLVSSAIGGWGAGILADKFGRVRILQLTIAWFALFTFLSGFTNSYGQLMLTRMMQGLGFGGEWSVGSVLVAERLCVRHEAVLCCRWNPGDAHRGHRPVWGRVVNTSTR
jgi:MFS family permease